MGEKKVAFINGLKVPEGSKIPGDCSTRVGKELKMGVPFSDQCKQGKKVDQSWCSQSRCCVIVREKGKGDICSSCLT